MTTNPYAEAVEAAARAHAAIQYRNTEKWDDLPTVDQEAMRRFVAPLVAAAVGPLLAPLRAALESLPIQEDFQDDDGNGMPVHFAGSGMALYPADYVHALDGFAASVEQALDAIEAGATSEGGRDE